MIDVGLTREEIVKKVLAIPKIIQILNNKQIEKTIYIKDKIINFICVGKTTRHCNSFSSQSILFKTGSK